MLIFLVSMCQAIVLWWQNWLNSIIAAEETETTKFFSHYTAKVWKKVFTLQPNYYLSKQVCALLQRLQHMLLSDFSGRHAGQQLPSGIIDKG